MRGFLSKPAGGVDPLKGDPVPAKKRTLEGRVRPGFLSVLELVKCLALGSGTALGAVLVVGAVSVVGTVSALEACVKALFSETQKDLETNPSLACDLRWLLVPCLVLGLCLSVGWRVGVPWLSLCLSRVVRARKVRKKRRLLRSRRVRVEPLDAC